MVTGRADSENAQPPAMYQARELEAQCHILGDEIGTVLENGCCDGENRGELERHQPNHSLSSNAQKKSAKLRSYRIMTMHTSIVQIILPTYRLDSSSFPIRVHKEILDALGYLR